MPTSVKNLSKQIGASNYIIAGNGTMLYDIKKEKVIYNQFMDKEKVLNIIEICEKNSIYYNIYTENAIIAKSLNYNVLYYNYENTKKPEGKKSNINIVENVYNYMKDINTSNVLKIMICDESKIIFERMIQKLKQINDISVLEVAHMSRKIIREGTKDVSIEYFYTEITNKNVNKWTATKFLMNKLNINEEEVAAIGDNVNDKEMVEQASLGVAMGGSYLEVNKIGNVVVGNNDEDGVAEAFEKYILI